MGKVVRFIFTAVGFVMIASLLVAIGGFVQIFSPTASHPSEAAVLQLDLEGIIMDSKEFVAKLREYGSDDKIKAIVVAINSPGGAVGPSQEIYSELKRVRLEQKKPVIASCSGLAASGAYYAAVAADKIVANPGTLMGSIGVIMEFANLEKLYDWARIRRYTITSGKFKDSGSEYREMTAEEHKLFQSLISEVYEQFKGAVGESRTKVEKSVLDGYTDGRVFTGATAVKLGFADQLGTLEDAIRLAGEMGGLGKKPKVFKPQKKHESLMDFISDDAKSQVSKIMAPVQGVQLMGQPLFMLPGTLGL